MLNISVTSRQQVLIHEGKVVRFSHLDYIFPFFLKKSFVSLMPDIKTLYMMISWSAKRANFHSCFTNFFFSFSSWNFQCKSILISKARQRISATLKRKKKGTYKIHLINLQEESH